MDRAGVKGMIALLVLWVCVKSGNVTTGPRLGLTDVIHVSSSGRMKWDEAPLSYIAVQVGVLGLTIGLRLGVVIEVEFSEFESELDAIEAA